MVMLGGYIKDGKEDEITKYISDEVFLPIAKACEEDIKKGVLGSLERLGGIHFDIAVKQVTDSNVKLLERLRYWLIVVNILKKFITANKGDINFTNWWVGKGKMRDAAMNDYFSQPLEENYINNIIPLLKSLEFNIDFPSTDQGSKLGAGSFICFYTLP